VSSTTWATPRDIAVLVPGPPRTTLRIVDAPERLDPARLGDLTSVERGWEHQLERGMRVELPEPWQLAVDAARVDLLLHEPTSDAVPAFEDWGFDDEARVGWERLGIRARRHARKRQLLDDPWTVLRAPAVDAAHRLLALRQVLVAEERGRIELVPRFPTEWLGQPVAVHDAPLRDGGRLSFALRWHGERPALLWDAPAGATLSIPALDPVWSTSTPVGETLLSPPPAQLLSMGDRRREGASLDAPESFS
jgi:hypothetical protein